MFGDISPTWTEAFEKQVCDDSELELEQLNLRNILVGDLPLNMDEVRDATC